MTSPRKALITGGTGLLGQGLCATVPPGWSAVSAHLRPYAVDTPDVLQVSADVRSRASVERLFKEHRFDAVVHAAGIASVDYSERHVEQSTASNLGGTRNIAELCAASGARLVYISTNAVFDGMNAPYRESAPANPVNAYGRIKLACERLVQEVVPRQVIARPILMYGWPHSMGRPNPATWIIDALEREETVRVVDDVFENPLHNMCAALAIWTMVSSDISGIIHLAGRDVISRYDFARTVAQVFALDASRIHPVSSAVFPEIARRPPNTSLVTERMESELGVPPSTVEEGLRLMATRARKLA